MFLHCCLRHFSAFRWPDASSQARSQRFKCPCQLIRAAGATAFAIYAFQKADDILYPAAFAEPRKALGVAVAAFDNFHTLDDISFCFKVNLSGTGNATGGEGCTADAVSGGI